MTAGALSRPAMPRSADSWNHRYIGPGFQSLGDRCCRRTRRTRACGVGDLGVGGECRSLSAGSSRTSAPRDGGWIPRPGANPPVPNSRMRFSQGGVAHNTVGQLSRWNNHSAMYFTRATQSLTGVCRDRCWDRYWSGWPGRHRPNAQDISSPKVATRPGQTTVRW